MLLKLLALTPVNFGKLSVPTHSELRELERVRADLTELPKIFSLPKEKVEQRVKPFLDRLQQTVELIPKNANAEHFLRNESSDSKIINAIIDWSMNKSQLDRIRIISDTVASYNERRAERQEPTTRYLTLLNEFLNDSGKSINFDDQGYISVKIGGASEEEPISSLSSGEAQIFVILTHLTFNPFAQRANVFIIDEPELSLHVRWQEIFVESVRSANPSIQYILATHSPSIILDKLDECIDLSKKRRGQSRG
jgi:predicted ATP-dependent endonuclease of OLD family